MNQYYWAFVCRYFKSYIIVNGWWSITEPLDFVNIIMGSITIDL